MAYLAPSLVIARAEINARWPGRDLKSDGWIGDPAHAATDSDHNPDGKGCVHAIDTDKDGIDPDLLVQRATAHPATEYVIYNRVIRERVNAWRARGYKGTNAHTEHVHISIRHTAAAETSTQPWGISQQNEEVAMGEFLILTDGPVPNGTYYSNYTCCRWMPRQSTIDRIIAQGGAKPYKNLGRLTVAEATPDFGPPIEWLGGKPEAGPAVLVPHTHDTGATGPAVPAS